jgi:hypothetical protein
MIQSFSKKSETQTQSVIFASFTKSWRLLCCNSLGKGGPGMRQNPRGGCKPPCKTPPPGSQNLPIVGNGSKQINRAHCEESAQQEVNWAEFWPPRTVNGFH